MDIISLPNPPKIPPLRSGWILDNEGLYKINWFEGNMSPGSLDVYTEEDNDAKISEGEGKSYRV